LKLTARKAADNKVVVATDIKIPDNSIELLSKGPNFAIAPSTNKARISVQHETEIALNHLAFQIRWQEAMKLAIKPNLNLDSAVSNLSNILLESPFDKYTTQPPISNIKLNRKLSALVMKS